MLSRTVRFGDTDSAGVIHFYQLFRWCHEAWEESLERYGLAAPAVFPGARGQAFWPDIALPVVHCEADFIRPVYNGDRLKVLLVPQRLDPGCFEVSYQFQLDSAVVATGLIRHAAIDSKSRDRCALPKIIALWLEASCLSRLKDP